MYRQAVSHSISDSSPSFWRDKQSRDMILCLIIFTLAFGGLANLQSISSVVAEKSYQDPSYFVKKQALWLFLALIGMMFFASFPLDLLRRLSGFAMLLSIFSLLLVFIPGLGKSVHSSYGNFHRWLNLGVVSIQPSEFAKVVLICFTASHLSREIDVSQKKGKYTVLAATLLVITMLAAILMEPQYGTTLCMLGVVFLMVYIVGFPVFKLALLFASFLPLLIILAVFWKYRLHRLLAWLNPYEHRYEGGYQLVTSFRAFESGGFWGTELASGFAHRYLTYGYSDFAFALFAEDFGWIGVCLLLGCYAFLLFRVYFLLQKIKNPFAFMLGSGALFMLFSQTLLNLLAVTGLLPTTGVSLPFLSYGGSSLIATACLSGILLNVSRYTEKKTSYS